MRGLVLLLLGGGLIWAVLHFFPSSEGPEESLEPGGGVEEPTTPGTSVLGGQDTADVDEQADPPALPASSGANGAPAASDAGAGDQGGGFTVPVSQADLIALGSTVAHGSGQEVLDWLQASDHVLDADMEWAMASFAAVLANDRGTARERAQKISSEDALPERVRWVLQRVLSGNFEGPWPAMLSGGDPLEVGLLIRTAVIEAAALAERRRDPEAAERLTFAFEQELSALWPANFVSLNEWRELLDAVQARHRFNPKGSWPSHQMTVQPGDSLGAIRKRYLAEFPDRLINTGLIAKVNGIDPSLIHPDQVLRIPTERVTMLVDLDAHWLLYYHGDEVAAAYPVGIGGEGEETIVGTFTIGEKQVEPTWFPRGRAPVVFGEDDNPLGTRYMTWFQDDEKTSYGFHGTWEPETIGGNESDGCIRMYNHDVEEFFELVPLHTRFRVQP